MPLGWLLGHLAACWEALGASWQPLGASWAPGSLLEPSWNASWSLWGRLGSLLERSWRLLDRSGSALGAYLEPTKPILGAKRRSKWRPRGSQIDIQERLELKTRFLQKVLFFHWNSLIFKVLRPPWGAQKSFICEENGFMKPEVPQKASRRPLGALLEASRAEKKCS